MAKLVFIGAGSSVFVKNVVGDCMLSPVLKDSEFALYDIDPVRLEDSRRMLTALNHNMGGHAQITAYLGVEKRRDALRGAAYVINAIQVGLYEPCTVTDFEVPKKYGLRQTMQNDLNRTASQVLATYVYTQGIKDGNYSFSTAISLFNSAINLVLICIVNYVSRKISEVSLW